MKQQNININGQLFNKNKLPLAGLRIEAWDKDLLIDDFLGEGLTDANGNFSISFDTERFKEFFFDRKPDVYFKIYYKNRLVYSTIDELICNISADVNNVDICVDIPLPQAGNAGRKNKVFGIISDLNGRPISKVKVAIFDVDLRQWSELNETLTDKKGAYELHWGHDQLYGKGRKTGDIAVKVFTADGKTELYKTPMKQVRFNASEKEEINVTVSMAIPLQGIEYDFILNEVRSLADGIAISDLKENAEHSDITFLSNELEIEAVKIEHLVVAHRLSNYTKIDAAFFYAIFRKDTLIANRTGVALNARFSININSDDQLVVFDTALIDFLILETAVKGAIKEQLISDTIADQFESIQRILEGYKEEATSYYAEQHPQKVVEVLVDFVKAGKLEEIQQLFTTFKGNFNDVLDQLTDTSFYQSDDSAQSAKTSLELGKMLGFGNSILPHILSTKNINKPEDIAQLAKLNKADWKNEIIKSNSGADTDQFVNNYASVIVRKFEQEFPTQAFAAQLERENKTVFKNQEAMVSFFSENDQFDLVKENVDVYLNKISSSSDTPEMRNELKSVQRIFKLIPHYGKTVSLMDEGIHSAQSIVAKGKQRFVSEITLKTAVSEKEATEIFAKAEQQHLAAMLVAGELNDAMGAIDIASFETTGLAKKLEAVGADFPNLKSLFKLTDVCECEQCRSVYSPAAYLVEILQFLHNRVVTDTVHVPPVTTNIAKEVLFSRRPDLGEIDLSCSNANTPLKYIDLVCELLEEAIAPDRHFNYSGDILADATQTSGPASPDLIDAINLLQIELVDPETGSLSYVPANYRLLTDAQLIDTTILVEGTKPVYYLRDAGHVFKIVFDQVVEGENTYQIYQLRQTFGTAEELDAAPEYTNLQAYKNLEKASYAFTLPFNLNHAEATAYFHRFNVDRSELMQAFQTSGSPEDAAIAAEQLGITAAERSLLVTGLTTNADLQKIWNVPAPGLVVPYMEKVDHFLDKTGLSYKELGSLLRMKFVNINRDLYINHTDDSCDTAQKVIANLDEDILDRVHRFLRLQRKTGWRFDVLDAIIMQPRLGAEVLNDDCLIKAGMMVKIAEKTGIKFEELIGLYGEIPFESTSPTTKSLYQKLFLNKAGNGTIDEALQPEKIDGSGSINAQLESIATGLQTKKKNLEVLVTLLPTDELSFENLSYLLGLARLSKKLKLKAEELKLFVKMSGLMINQEPSETLQFIEMVEIVRNSSLTISDIQYLLKHESDTLATRILPNEKIIPFFISLKTEYAKLALENKFRFDSHQSAIEQRETLVSALSELEKCTQEDVTIIVDFLDKKWVSIDAAKLFVQNHFDQGIDRSLIDTAIVTLSTAVGEAPVESAQKAFIQAVLNAIDTFRLSKKRKEVLNQSLATWLKVDVDIIDCVLKYAVLKQTLPSTELLVDLLSIAFVDPVVAGSYGKQFDAIRLLNKLLQFIKGLHITPKDAAWFFQQNKEIGWLKFDQLPYAVGHTPIVFNDYLNFIQFLQLSIEWTPVADPLDANNSISLLSLVESTRSAATTETVFMNNLAVVTGYAATDLMAIDHQLHGSFNRENYQKTKSWTSLFTAASLVNKLSVEVAQIPALIATSLGQPEVNLLRSTLKSRYDESTWLNTLKEITDTLRPQKRDALVAYLLATNPGVKTKNDLYEYFLVDVEMEACMPSSRIVLAHNSIQLFVQRCLMGLEPKAVAEKERDLAWEQWKWMKNYRVWEANRKVFLYPENWYEVGLSDDKSYLLTELIAEIQQNELTDDTANEALIKYLEKLDAIAFLEIMTTWYDTVSKNMHVFARTKGGDPEIYFYRRFEKEKYWTPWEKIELDISGDHLVAFKRNNRLCLAWLVFSEDPEINETMVIPAGPGATVQATAKRKLKIQLACSEFSNKKWQPKKLSKQAVFTPSYYTSGNLNRDLHNVMYAEVTSQVLVFKTNFDNEEIGHETVGIFDLVGCSGYPEVVSLAGKDLYFPDFFPDFKDAYLTSQKYREQNSDETDELAVRNSIRSAGFSTLLEKTPGNFRLTYPLQFTAIDLIAALKQLYQLILSGDFFEKQRQFKMPLGTLLPYFKEDSRHAYVVIPGYYKKITINDRIVGLTDEQKRTASDVFQLMEDCWNWLLKIQLHFEQHPTSDLQVIVNTIITDVDFQHILKELSLYFDLDIIWGLLIGNTTNEAFKAFLIELKDAETLVYGEQFRNMYHPLVCSLKSTLYKGGIPAFMSRETQLQKTAFDFNLNYGPNPLIIAKTMTKRATGAPIPLYPVEDLDFSVDGSYSSYNWDMFYRVPLHLATNLTKNQRFEEAQSWFHYLFNPTGALAGSGVQKYWVTKPFYLNQEADYTSQRIDDLLYSVADISATSPALDSLKFAISEWRSKPFKPDVVARFRPVAYQKVVLMKYIDNLTEWGDYLFRQDTMESVAQATQMYILADKLLGPKPKSITPIAKPPYETYNQLEAKLDKFGNALIELENILPELPLSPDEGSEETLPVAITLSTLYFCIPPNDKMMEYWDRIADRLFKIRHCQNIDGVERSLALFAPPIDPGMLVRATASGLSLSAVIAGLNAPTPYYRFIVLSQKASELAQEVRGLGNSLLQALEKKDGEAMGLLRNELELKVQNAVKDLKDLQILEATEQIEVLKRTKLVTEERYRHYNAIAKIIPKEQLNLDKLGDANQYQKDSQIIRTVAGALSLIPEFHVGASGFGGSPHVVMQLGGSAISKATNIGADVLNVLSTVASFEANRASILGGYDRRFDDWKLQERLAKKELKSIEKQLAAAEIRKEISKTDLRNHLLQIENTKKTDEFMRSKFTNKELYDWMIGQISGVYFRSYQLAHEFAKKAERSYRFELGNDDSYISYGYWDSLKKGLQSADQLIHDIKRMETGYLDKNKREYEITKHISLAQLDPLALVRLRSTGVCDFEIPEVLFDMDHPGHYFRRLKSVSVSLPCIAGPYTSVSAKLSLINNRYRKNILPTPEYKEDLGNDPRFAYNIGSIQSIATSNSQNDSGVFELNFKDERYLPFEGTGAISSWRLELPTEVHQFNYETISDVILHVKYTAREGGSGMKNAANGAVLEQLALIKQGLIGEDGLHIALNLKHDLPNEWHLLKQNGTVDLTILKSRLPYLAQTIDSEIVSIKLLAKLKPETSGLTMTVAGDSKIFTELTSWHLWQQDTVDVVIGDPFTLAINAANNLKLADLMLIVKYEFTA